MDRFDYLDGELDYAPDNEREAISGAPKEDLPQKAVAPTRNSSTGNSTRASSTGNSTEDTEFSKQVAEKAFTPDNYAMGMNPGILAMDYDKVSEGIKHQAKLLRANFRSWSPFTNWAWAGVRRGLHNLGVIDRDTYSDEPFYLEDQLKKDGIPEEDAHFYEGCDTYREYEFIKSNLEAEREDEILWNEATFAEIIPSIIADFAAFGPIAKAIKAAGSLVGVTQGCSKLLSGMGSNFVRESVKAVSLGTAMGAADFAAKYDIALEEAGAHAALYAAIGTGFGGGIGAVKDIVKCFRDRLANSPRKILMDAIKQTNIEDLGFRIEALREDKNVGEKLYELLATKPVFATKFLKTHPIMGLESNNERVRKMTTELFNLTSGLAPVNLENRELGMFIFREKLSNDFVQADKALKKIDKKLTKETGISSYEWFTRAWYGGDEAIPEAITERETILKHVGTMSKQEDAFKQLYEEVKGEPLELQGGYLPRDLAEGKIDSKKMLERAKSGDVGDRPFRTTSRIYSAMGLETNAAQVKDLEKRFLMWKRAQAIAENPGVTDPIAALESYAASPEMQNTIERYYSRLLELAGQKGGQERDFYEPLKRKFLVPDELLARSFTKDAFYQIYSDLSTNTNKLLFEKAVKRQGYETYAEYRNAVETDYNNLRAAIKGETPNDIKARLEIDAQKSQALTLIDQTKAIVLRRVDESPSLFPQMDIKTMKFLTGAQNYMYATTLGSAALSAISDIGTMTLRLGLKKVIPNLCVSLGQSFANGARSLVGLPKTELRRALDALALSIDTSREYATLRYNAFGNDGLWYEATNKSFLDKFVYSGKRLANAAVHFSGLNYIDHTFKRAVARCILQDLYKDPKYKERIWKGIATGEWDDEVQKIVLKNVIEITNVPQQQDMPITALRGIGRFFYTLQSWAYANMHNYIYPIMKNGTARYHMTESVAAMLMLEMIKVQARGWLRDEVYDFKTEEGRKEFATKVLGQGLDDYVGALALYWSWMEAIKTWYQKRNVLAGAGTVLPLSGTFDNFMALGGGIISLFNGELRYPSARKALRALPFNNNIFIEPAVTALAENIASKKRKYREGRKPR